MKRAGALVALVGLLAGIFAALSVAPAMADQWPSVPDAGGAFIHCNMSLATDYLPSGSSWQLACQTGAIPQAGASIGLAVDRWCTGQGPDGSGNCEFGRMSLGGATVSYVAGSYRFQVTMTNPNIDNSPRNFIPTGANHWIAAGFGFNEFGSNCGNCIVIDSLVIGTTMPDYPVNYYAGGTAGGAPPPPPPAPCAITSVAANWPTDGPQMSTQYQLQVTYTGGASSLSIDYGDSRAPSVMSPPADSPVTVAVYWDQVGTYSAEVDCTSTVDGSVSKWAIPVTVVQQSKSLTACLPSSIGAVLDPTAWVKSMGCVLEWAFVPSGTTKDQMAGMWATAQTKAPFSFAYDVATFLPNTANQLAQGIADRDRPNVIGDRECQTFIDSDPLSGTDAGGHHYDNCIDSQISSNGLSGYATLLRSIILMLILVTLALGIWRMTARTIG